jgi:ATP phosphoribosyltransferase regulatory subunit
MFRSDVGKADTGWRSNMATDRLHLAVEWVQRSGAQWVSDSGSKDGRLFIMVADVSARLAALEAQAARMLSVLTKAGYERISPDIIQPAEVFLDVIGEDLRSRTYVFQDPEGSELCLRPDLTVPTCLLHLARHTQPDIAARYCYSGPAFRFQPQGGSRVRPREFRQLGLEFFAAPDSAAAEVEIIRLTLDA